MSCFQGISSNRSWNQWNSKQGEGGKNREKSNESFSSCLLDYHCSSEHQNHIILCVWGKINHIASRKWGGRSTPNPHLSSICFKPSAETQWTNLERNHALNIMGLVEKSGPGWRRASGNQFLREFWGLIFMWAVGNPWGDLPFRGLGLGFLELHPHWRAGNWPCEKEAPKNLCLLLITGEVLSRRGRSQKSGCILLGIFIL